MTLILIFSSLFSIKESLDTISLMRRNRIPNDLAKLEVVLPTVMSEV